jgi:hypothetical protein
MGSCLGCSAAVEHLRGNTPRAIHITILISSFIENVGGGLDCDKITSFKKSVIFHQSPEFTRIEAIVRSSLKTAADSVPNVVGFVELKGFFDLVTQGPEGEKINTVSIKKEGYFNASASLRTLSQYHYQPTPSLAALDLTTPRLLHPDVQTARQRLFYLMP